MSGAVIDLPDRTPADASEALKAAVLELRALVSLDPVMGATPVRLYFAFSQAAKACVAQRLVPPAPACGRLPGAYALVAYDFPFARHMIRIAGWPIATERAQQIVSMNAGLQGDTLQAAAASLGIEARPVLAFDAAAVKQLFCPQTQETFTHLFRLELDPERHQTELNP